MKDRFKFRVWHKPWGVTEQPEMLYNAESTYDYMGEVPASSFGSVLNDKSFEVMQCTGLKDKNGKLIYEGDIVKIPDDWDIYGLFAGEKREIYFNEGGFRLKPKWDKYSHGNWLEDTKDFEVIGNIYENKDLLNE